MIPTRDEWKRGVRYAIIAVVLGLIVWNAGSILTGLLPFVVAYGLSIAIDPLVTRLAKTLHIGRGWSALVVLCVILLLGWWIGTWLAATITDATARFIDAFPQYR